MFKTANDKALSELLDPVVVFKTANDEALSELLDPVVVFKTANDEALSELSTPVVVFTTADDEGVSSSESFGENIDVNCDASEPCSPASATQHSQSLICQVYNVSHLHC